MCQDREVAAFDLDVSTERVTNVQPLAHAAQAPLSVRLDGPNPTRDLTRFVVRRAMSPDRPDLEDILAATQAENAIDLALRAHGLSLSDPYWYRAPHTNASWHSLNFFDNDWDPGFGQAVIAHDWEALTKASCLSPDVTCAGFNPKAWIRTDDGPHLLKGARGGLGAEPLGEVAAARLAVRILPESVCVPYDLVRLEGKAFSSCPLMTTADEELVSIRDLPFARSRHHTSSKLGPAWDETSIADYVEALGAVGAKTSEDTVVQLTICATLSMQTDLHPSNCGVIHDTRTGAVRPAPLFDFGGCFGTSVNEPGAQAVIAMPSLAARFLVGRLRHLDPSWDYSWYDSHALDGFAQELEALLLQDELLPPEYVAIMIELFNCQLDYVNDVVSQANAVTR